MEKKKEEQRYHLQSSDGKCCCRRERENCGSISPISPSSYSTSPTTHHPHLRYADRSADPITTTRFRVPAPPGAKDSCACIRIFHSMDIAIDSASSRPCRSLAWYSLAVLHVRTLVYLEVQHPIPRQSLSPLRGEDNTGTELGVG
jgi:hypothetical protein